MILLESNELLEHITSIIHEETQRHDLHADLTVKEIHKFSDSGSLDFGGSEFKSAKYTVIKPEKRNSNDNYGWWELTPGTYQARFNERIQQMEDSLALLVPHHHTEKTGIIAGVKLITPANMEDDITFPFHVPESGVSIKENARFASVFVLAK